DVEPAWQGATVADAALHARLHRRPQFAQAVADPVGAAPALLVLEHHLRDALAGLPRACQQFVAAGERMRYRGGVGDDAVLGRLVLVDHEAAADGVVVAAGDLVAFGVVRGEAHAVGVVGQLLPLVHQQVALFLERDLVPAGQADAALAADALHGGGDDVGIDHVRHVAFQAHHDRLVGAMAATGEGQRAEDFGAYAGDVLQAPGLDQPAVDEAGGGAHGPDGVGGTRPDADLVEVESADGHAAILSGPSRPPASAHVPHRSTPVPAADAVPARRLPAVRPGAGGAGAGARAGVRDRVDRRRPGAGSALWHPGACAAGRGERPGAGLAVRRGDGTRLRGRRRRLAFRQGQSEVASGTALTPPPRPRR